ncbi:MAG: hypothetical protein IPF54_13180 [Draconibacterium sp.]|nr:hypothetical protein [Draconibacterium sp.]
MAVSPSEGGTTDPNVGMHSYTENSNVTVKAVRNTGYIFNGWTGNVSNPDATITTVNIVTIKPLQQILLLPELFWVMLTVTKLPIQQML